MQPLYWKLHVYVIECVRPGILLALVISRASSLLDDCCPVAAFVVD